MCVLPYKVIKFFLYYVLLMFIVLCYIDLFIEGGKSP